jgi:WD40 repeat protein
VTSESRALVRTAASPIGQERATLRGHLDAVRSLAVLDGGKALVSRGQDGVIKVWDLSLNRERLTLGGKTLRVRSMGLSPGDHFLAAGIRTGGPRAAPPQAGKRAAPASVPPANPAPIAPRPVMPDAPFAPEVQVENPGTQVPKVPDAKTGAKGAQPAAPAAQPVEAKVWSLDTGREVASLSGHNGDVVALQFSPDGKTLATASRAGVVKLWSTADYKEKLAPKGRKGGVDLVLFSRDGKTLIGASAAGLVTLWDVDSGKVRATFSHFGGMNAIVLSPGGKTLATGGGRAGSGAEASPAPGDIRIWDVTTGRRLVVLPVPTGRVTRLAFAPDSRTLALATDSPTIMLWDVAEASPRATVTWPSGPALFLVFSPDGKTLAAGGEDTELRLWDASSGKLESTLRGHTDAIDWIAFSRDGRTMFTASRDTTLRVWDFPTMRP